MPEPLIRERTAAEAAMPDLDANEALGRLNRALAELGMPAAALTVSNGRGLLGWPEAVVRLVHAGDPESVFGEIRIPLQINDVTGNRTLRPEGSDHA